MKFSAALLKNEQNRVAVFVCVSQKAILFDGFHRVKVVTCVVHFEDKQSNNCSIIIISAGMYSIHFIVDSRFFGKQKQLIVYQKG
jgi:hypothetical protein